MVRVRTIRTHSNRYGESYQKLGSAGAVYTAPEEVARNLIAMGYVEDADQSAVSSPPAELVEEPVAEQPKKRRNKKAG